MHQYAFYYKHEHRLEWLGVTQVPCWRQQKFLSSTNSVSIWQLIIFGFTAWNCLFFTVFNEKDDKPTVNYLSSPQEPIKLATSYWTSAKYFPQKLVESKNGTKRRVNIGFSCQVDKYSSKRMLMLLDFTICVNWQLSANMLAKGAEFFSLIKLTERENIG